jgi:hypothetical protein
MSAKQTESGAHPRASIRDRGGTLELIDDAGRLLGTLVYDTALPTGRERAYRRLAKQAYRRSYELSVPASGESRRFVRTDLASG